MLLPILSLFLLAVANLTFSSAVKLSNVDHTSKPNGNLIVKSFSFNIEKVSAIALCRLAHSLFEPKFSLNLVTIVFCTFPLDCDLSTRFISVQEVS